MTREQKKEQLKQLTAGKSALEVVAEYGVKAAQNLKGKGVVKLHS